MAGAISFGLASPALAGVDPNRGFAQYQFAGMRIVGLVGAGHMGSGLGWALREGGHDVVTSLAGRSARTARLAGNAGLRIASRPVDVVAEADVIHVITPPGAASDAAAEIATTKAHRYVAEMREIARSQAAVGLTPSLFEAFVTGWADIADRPLADGRPETLPRGITASQVAEGLR